MIDFPDRVTGWLTEEEGRALADLSAGQTVLEIGSFHGRSTICMAQTAKYVVSVDPRDARDTSQPMTNTLIPFIQNLYDAGLLSKVAIHIGTTATIAPQLPRGLFTRVFIDGAHDYESVMLDLEWARKLLLPGGLIACHDYRAYPGEHDGRHDPDVNRAVEDVLRDGWYQVGRHGTVVILDPPERSAAAYRANGIKNLELVEALI